MSAIATEERIPAPTQSMPPAETFAQMVLRRFLKHKLAVASVGVLLLLIAAAIAGPMFLPKMDDIDLSNTSQVVPSLKHLLGTDELGEDVLSRLLYAGRISLFVGLTSSFLGVLIGTLVGSLAGFYGKWVDTVLMRITDGFLSISVLMLAMVLSAFLAGKTIVPFLPQDLQQLVIIVGIISCTSWMGVARLVRGEFLSLREQEFVEASRAVGGKPRWIIFRHMIPNAMAPILVAATFAVGDAIVFESALSFLGLGIQPPIPSWGNMLTNAQEYMISTPWLAIYPGMMIFLVVVSINFIGDGLRDALDPKLKGR